MWQVQRESRMVGRSARTPEVLSLLGLCSAACKGVALREGAIMRALPCKQARNCHQCSSGTCVLSSHGNRRGPN